MQLVGQLKPPAQKYATSHSYSYRCAEYTREPLTLPPTPNPASTCHRGLDAVRSSARVYLEAYTSLLLVPKETLEEFYGKEVVVADREMVEMVSGAAWRRCCTGPLLADECAFVGE